MTVQIPHLSYIVFHKSPKSTFARNTYDTFPNQRRWPLIRRTTQVALESGWWTMDVFLHMRGHVSTRRSPWRDYGDMDGRREQLNSTSTLPHALRALSGSPRLGCHCSRKDARCLRLSTDTIRSYQPRNIICLDVSGWLQDYLVVSGKRRLL